MRVLVVRLGSMGDVIHAVPAVAALRAAHPDAHIGWAIERRWMPLLASDATALSRPRSPQRPLVDTVHVVNTLGWRKAPFSNETWTEARNTFRAMRAEKYDDAIDFQGSIKSAVVARLSGAPTRIGFAQPREKPASMFYTSVLRTSACHVIDQNLSLASLLIRSSTQSEFTNQKSEIPLWPSVSSEVNFPFDPAAERSVWDRLPSAGPTTRFAILTPGAGWGAKQWPAARYAEVARALVNAGVICLLNYSPAEEPLAREVEAASGGAARPFFCTLSELIALTRRASLFIGGDTGPMHLANALGVPVVALFGPTDPARTGPYPLSQSKLENQKSKMVSQSAIDDRQSSIVLRHRSSRTDRRHRPEPDPGLLQISTEEVIAAAKTLLSRQPTADSRLPAADSREPFA